MVRETIRIWPQIMHAQIKFRVLYFNGPVYNGLQMIRDTMILHTCFLMVNVLVYTCNANRACAYILPGSYVSQVLGYV